MPGGGGDSQALQDMQQMMDTNFKEYTTRIKSLQKQDVAFDKVHKDHQW